MQEAARAGRVRFRSHALDELANEALSPDDAINCILMGAIVEDQFDVDYEEMKYLIYGDTLSGDEMCVVAKWDDYHNVVVITVYRLIVTDYEWREP